MKKNSRTKETSQLEETETREKDRLQREEKQEEGKGKILDSLAGSVDEVEEALEDSAEELSETAAFDPAAPMMKNRRTFFAAGVIIILLAIVGLVSTVQFIVGTTRDILNQTSLKNEFAEFLKPMALIDSPAFDSAENVPSSVVISASIWRIILSGNTDKYESDSSNMTVSEIDVESAASALFGYGVNVEHQTVNSGATIFEYSSSTKSYKVPLNAYNSTYWPRVSKISSVGDTFTLVVEYMPPIMGVGENAIPEPSKSMIYTVSRTASSMTLRSIQYPPTEDSEIKE